MLEESTSAVVELSDSSESSSAPSGTSPSKEGYSVSAQDLAELGIESKDDSSDSFEYGKLSATPKPLKEEQALKAKLKLAKLSQKQETDEVDLDALSEPDVEEDEWVQKALKPDEDELLETEEEVEEELHELVVKGKSEKLPLSEIKARAQKLTDYSNLMRELKGEREAFENDRTRHVEMLDAMKTEYNALKKEKEQVDSLIEYIRDTNSDVYGQVEHIASEFKRTYQNPYMERALQELKNELKQEIGSVNKRAQEAENEELRSDYYAQLAELKDLHNSKFAKYGIKLDEVAIQKEWIESGKSLKKIYGELHGDKLVSVADSKRALMIKQRASKSAPTLGRVRQAAKPIPDLAKKMKSMSYGQIANELVKGRIR